MADQELCVSTSVASIAILNQASAQSGTLMPVL